MKVTTAVEGMATPRESASFLVQLSQLCCGGQEGTAELECRTGAALCVEGCV